MYNLFTWHIIAIISYNTNMYNFLHEYVYTLDLLVKFIYTIIIYYYHYSLEDPDYNLSPQPPKFSGPALNKLHSFSIMDPPVTVVVLTLLRQHRRYNVNCWTRTRLHGSVIFVCEVLVQPRAWCWETLGVKWRSTPAHATTSYMPVKVFARRPWSSWVLQLWITEVDHKLYLVPVSLSRYVVPAHVMTLVILLNIFARGSWIGH